MPLILLLIYPRYQLAKRLTRLKKKRKKNQNHALPHIICHLLTIICPNSALFSF